MWMLTLTRVWRCTVCSSMFLHVSKLTFDTIRITADVKYEIDKKEKEKEKHCSG